MKTHKTFLALSLLTGLLFVVLNGCGGTRSEVVSADNPADGFEDASRSAADYYRPFGEALDAIKVKQYDRAIDLLNSCLPHAKFGPEIAMVHRQLAGIYSERKDLAKEIYSREQVVKYTANSTVRLENEQRINELKRLMAAR